MHLSEREIFKIFCFSLLTLGIYYLYWIYTLSTEFKVVNDESRNPALEVFLGIITLGFYFVYWHYKMAKEVYQMAQNKGYLGITDKSKVCLLVSIFPLGGYLSMGIIQDQINTIVMLSKRKQASI